MENAFEDLSETAKSIERAADLIELATTGLVAGFAFFALLITFA